MSNGYLKQLSDYQKIRQQVETSQGRYKLIFCRVTMALFLTCNNMRITFEMCEKNRKKLCKTILNNNTNLCMRGAVYFESFQTLFLVLSLSLSLSLLTDHLMSILCVLFLLNSTCFVLEKSFLIRKCSSCYRWNRGVSGSFFYRLAENYQKNRRQCLIITLIFSSFLYTYRTTLLT